MRKALVAGCFIALLAGSGRAESATEIVVAIRYLQATGTSHAHLFLYREDGKFLRQLTSDNSGQDQNPIFAPGGETIVFRRAKPDAAPEFWSIRPSGAALQKLESAPDWYASSKRSPFYTNYEPTDETSTSAVVPPEATDAPDDSPKTYRAPDGSMEIILRPAPDDPDDEVDGPGHGRRYALQNLKSGRETELGKVPGFYGLWDGLHLRGQSSERFLFDGPLRVFFFELHLNSTDGDTVFALDLTKSRLVRLSPNWAMPVPLPGDGAFLTLTENRYVRIPGSSKTANCSYIERWSAALAKVRYAKEKTAAIVYGASCFRPSKTPAVLTINYHTE